MKEEKKKKALIFDVGGVLVFYNHMIAAKKMSKLIDVDPKKIFKIINGGRNNFTVSYELGNPKEIYWGVMEKKFGKKIPYDKFNKIWCEIFWPNKDLLETLKKLKKEYRLALISNIGPLHWNYLNKKYQLGKISSIKTLSYKVKLRKPDKKIYLNTLRKLKVNPEEAIFIDDKKENSTGAKKIGMHGIHFKSNKNLLIDLKRLN